MATNFSDKLTVVIPTYNRPKYLRRSLHYWGRTDFMVIVADGSEKQFDGEIPSNVSYFHENELNPTLRSFTALQKVRTPYVVLCADDDFFSLKGIFACIDFLNNQSDYASVQGHAIEFEIEDKNNITVRTLNDKRIGHRIDGNAAIERLSQLFDEYVYQIYSVYRTPMLKLAIETCVDQKNGSYMELTAAIVPSIFGKHKVLPIFYSARENLPGSGSSTVEALRFDILNTEGMLDYAQWRDKISRIYSEAEGVPLNVALEIVEDTFAKYCAWDLRVYPHRRSLHERGKSKWFPIKKLLKKIIPPSLLKARRKILERLRNGGNTSGVLTNSPGFPWSDPDAAIEWQKMVNTINNHSSLVQ